jgi:hypothetical protein
MSLAIIEYREFFQFSCFTENRTATPLLAECAGLAFFTAFSITDVILPDPQSQFFFNPELIFPESQGSPPPSKVGQPLSNYQRFTMLLLAPAKGFTFANSGQAPMLIFRRVEVPTPPGKPTLLSYQASVGDYVVFQPRNPVPIPTTNLADPNDIRA